MANIGNQTGDTGNYRGIYGSVRGVLITMPENGTASSISAFCFNNGTPGIWQCGIYNTSGTLLDSTATRNNIAGSPWYTFTGLTLSMTASTDYILVVGQEGVDDNPDNGISYAAAGTYDGRGAEIVDGANPMPSSLTFNAASSEDYQIYLTYTPGGGGGEVSWTPKHDLSKSHGPAIAVRLNGALQ